MMASSFFSTCCREKTGIRISLLNLLSPGSTAALSASDLLRSPVVAQPPELVRVGGTDLVQRGQVPGQVCPKVLCGFREIRDILETKY